MLRLKNETVISCDPKYSVENSLVVRYSVFCSCVDLTSLRAIESLTRIVLCRVDALLLR